jgi:hypothetical protein
MAAVGVLVAIAQTLLVDQVVAHLLSLLLLRHLELLIQ